MTDPLLSVIVPTRHRNDVLAECLDCLSPDFQTIDSSMYEVIVTDDGRASTAKDMIDQKYSWANWTCGPAKGPAANRNNGASAAKGKWLVFIDDDCLPSEHLLAAYFDAATEYQNDELIVLEGPTIRSSDPPSLLWEAPHNPKGGAWISANFAIRKEEFLQLDGFDTRYRHAAFEDTEFFARFRMNVGHAKFVSAASVEHPLRRVPTPKQLARRWEGKVIYAIDQGASGFTILWRLPWHVLRVIQSRFKGVRWNRETLTAASLFVREWLIVLWKTPQWVFRWSRAPRSPFWRDHVSKAGPQPRYGF